MLVLSIILSVTIMSYAKWENGKRTRGERDGRLSVGAGGVSGGDEDRNGMLGYRHPEFRYTM